MTMQPVPMPEKVIKRTFVDDAYNRLKHAILTNELLPGYQAPEPEVAAWLNMSRTPVREALIQLQSEGLVELIPRRGVRVLPIQAKDMREIYEILSALEPSAAENIARRGLTEEDLAPLEQATSEMEQALDANDLIAWAEADDRFHRALLEINGNERLNKIVSALIDQAHRARMMTLRLRKKPVKSTQDHRKILEYLRNGEAKKAGALFRQHRNRASTELLNILEDFKVPVL
ncbi:GntR family transcriptional regulator [Cohaesibacter celericrescens]|uniref:GntR family transcriptional regulator n=1 Tax=Cohaesibacter celericrescens TaxID=2067669 RepID=A0A2N5XVS4_9HYPH|nr:GntR family transcriptional regulator [Cohaesibacter celericrescens]PLW78577.1 GntR family transcriptional regulator [Cohaesibacter celericrescens]